MLVAPWSYFRTVNGTIHPNGFSMDNRTTGVFRPDFCDPEVGVSYGEVQSCLVTSRMIVRT